MNQRVEIRQRLVQDDPEQHSVRFITFRAVGDSATALRLDWSEWREMGCPEKIDVVMERRDS